MGGGEAALPGRQVMNSDMMRSTLFSMFDEQLFAVLSTHGKEGPPHATIVCFAAADQLHSLIFVTPVSTRKYLLLKERPEAAIFIDDRRGEMSVLKEIRGVEARGEVSELEVKSIAIYRSIFLRKYPDLRSFVDAQSTAWFRLKVECYDLVYRFQDVLQYRPGDLG
jgi:uncharacterized protein YhbP (UPF0306 family)